MSHSTHQQTESEAVMMRDDELARMLGVSKRTIWRMLSAGLIPSPIRLGGSTRWRRVEILDWIARGCPPCR